MPNPVALLCSDLHLSLRQPACRADDNWLEVQARYLQQLKDLAQEVPVICAGDIFDNWNVPPELVNFALENLPDEMVCVPGQHDLPNHRLDLMHRSGYGVLRKAGKIVDISNGLPYIPSNQGFVAWGFPWSQPIRRLKTTHQATKLPCTPQTAVIHRYIWTDSDNSYQGATDNSHFKTFKQELSSYDAVVIGDNHKSWKVELPTTHILNCGTFIRRKMDEALYAPTVGLLYEDGTIKRQRLDVSEDKFHADAEEREEIAVNMQEFIDQLKGLGEHGLNFREAVRRRLTDDDVPPLVKEIVLRALDADNKER